MRLRPWIFGVLLVDLAVVAFIACGARTELPVPEGDETSEGGAPPDAGPDTPPDVPMDVPDDVVPDCVDPSTTYIYLVTSEYDLYSFNPKNNAFNFIGALDCPAMGGATPFSMGVDRKGKAYVVYNDGELFHVSTKDASCEETEFQVGQFGFFTFGMGFALDPGLMTDTLYVAEISFQAPSIGLGSIDPDTLDLSYIGPFSENPGNAMEMTSSSDGNLYGYFLNPAGSGGWVVEIDRNDATILDSTFISAGEQSSALAFAFWGGDFFVFTSPGGVTSVTRYRPSDGSVTVVTTLDRTVVGAGVSTCAPR